MGCSLLFRFRVRRHRHRTAAARSRSRRLPSGFMQAKMFVHVSSGHNNDTAACLTDDDVVGNGDYECVLSAGSTESPTRWTTGRWITRRLTGEQRSAHGKHPINHERTFGFSAVQIRFFLHS